MSHHINRTSAVVRILAKKLLEKPELGFDKEFLKNVIKVAPMHDLGKVAVDDVILRKPGKFTDEEYNIMKSHSAEGARMIRKVLAEVDDAAMTEAAVNVAHFFGFDRAFAIIEEGLGSQFDPVLGKIFLECRPELEKLYIEME